jgi:hypothetical protein
VVGWKPWTLEVSREWRSIVGPLCSVLAEVSMDAGTLACAGATIAPIVAIATATAIKFRVTAAYPQHPRIAANRGDCHALLWDQASADRFFRAFLPDFAGPRTMAVHASGPLPKRAFA